MQGYGGHVNGGGGMHGGMYGSPYGVPASGPMGLGVGVRLPDGRLIPNTPGSFGPGSTLRSNGLGLPPSGLSPGGLGALGGGGLHPGGMEGAEGLNALGGLGPKQLAAMEAVAAGVPMSAAQLSAAGLPEQLAALTAAIPAAGLPLSASDTGARLHAASCCSHSIYNSNPAHTGTPPSCHPATVTLTREV